MPKAINFFLKHFISEGNVFWSRTAKFLNWTQTAGKNFCRPAISATAPVFGMALAATLENLAVGQATTNIQKNIRRQNFIING